MISHQTGVNYVQTESFADFLKASGGTHPPDAIYCEGENFAAWQARFREKLESLLRWDLAAPFLEKHL